MFGQYSGNSGTGRAASNMQAGSARLKRVMDSPEQVAHLWAAQAQDSARFRDNFYFNLRRIYSYGSHYLAGMIMPDGVVLLNTVSYSVTTSRHLSAVRYAVNHKTRYSVYNLTEFAERLDSFERAKRSLASYAKQGMDSNGPAIQRERQYLSDAKRAGRKWIADHALRLEEEAGAYLVRLFGYPAATYAKLRTEAEAKEAKRKAAERKAKESAALEDAKRLGDMDSARFALAIPDASGRDIVSGEYTESPDDFRLRLARAHKASKAAGNIKRTRVLWDRLAALRAEARGEEADAIRPDAIAIAAERERRKLEAEEKQAAARAAWIAGERSAYSRLSDPEGGALLRIAGDPAKPEEAELQTSHGASVPLAHAIRAFRFVKLVRERGETWNRNGRQIRVGHYQLDSIDSAGNFRAGCHAINWPEVARVAKLAGVFDCSPSDIAVESSGH
jgi:hypothetical protein